MPLNATVLPALYVEPVTGVAMFAGGGIRPTTTLVVATAMEVPLLTVSVAVKVPLAVYVCVGLATVTTGDPSPKFQE